MRITKTNKKLTVTLFLEIFFKSVTVSFCYDVSTYVTIYLFSVLAE